MSQQSNGVIKGEALSANNVCETILSDSYDQKPSMHT